MLVKVLEAAGNRFVLLDSAREPAEMAALVRRVCASHRRRLDGLIYLSGTQARIFNSDGSEAEFCGNGARIVAFHLRASRYGESGRFHLGRYEVHYVAKRHRIWVSMPRPKELPFEGGWRDLFAPGDPLPEDVRWMEAGVPHLVLVYDCEDALELEQEAFEGLSRRLRLHTRFAPGGTNVTAVAPTGPVPGSFRVRTYERGIERESEACGSGVVAAAGAMDFVSRRGLRFRVKSGAQLLCLRAGGCWWLSGPIGEEGSVEVPMEQ